MDIYDVKVREGDHDNFLWSEGYGNPDNVAILFIMGANASSKTWPPELLERFTKHNYYVIVYDHRDTGKSSTTHESYCIEDLAEDALRVLRDHKVNKAHIVGLSMGGTIAQILAIRHPEKILSVSVMMTTFIGVDFTGSIQKAFAGHSQADGLPVPDRNVLEKLAERSKRTYTQTDEINRRVEEWKLLSGDKAVFNAEDFRRWEKSSIEHSGSLQQPSRHTVMRPADTSTGEDLKKTSVPFLIIQGGCDPLNPPPHGYYLSQILPDAEYVEIEEMGHALPSSVHGKVAKAIIGHINKHS